MHVKKKRFFSSLNRIMSQTESSFKSSLRNFQLSRGNTISLPTNTNASKSAFQSLRESASNTFSNVSSTVQGYIPIGTNIEEEEEEPWYQLSRLEVRKRTCQL